MKFTEQDSITKIVTNSLRYKIFVLLSFAILAIIGLFLAEYYSGKSETHKEEQYYQKTIGRIGSGFFNFLVSDEREELMVGLGGHDRLPDTDGMLFIFDESKKHCIWMKDMQFSIDILWFDESKQLIYEKRGIEPETYPENFCPDRGAKFVVELPAGAAAKNMIKLGDKLEVEGY